MEIDKIYYDGDVLRGGSVALKLKRKSFDPKILCATEESLKIGHEKIKLLSISDSDSYVVVNFSCFPADVAIISRYLGIDNRGKNELRSCEKCTQRKLYCNIRPIIRKVAAK